MLSFAVQQFNEFNDPRCFSRANIINKNVKKLILFCSSSLRVSIEIVVLNNYTKFTEKRPCGLRPATLLKKRLTLVFSCEFCEVFKNTFFTEHLRTTTFVHF